MKGLVFSQLLQTGIGDQLCTRMLYFFKFQKHTFNKPINRLAAVIQFPDRTNQTQNQYSGEVRVQLFQICGVTENRDLNHLTSYKNKENETRDAEESTMRYYINFAI